MFNDNLFFLIVLLLMFFYCLMIIVQFGFGLMEIGLQETNLISSSSTLGLSMRIFSPKSKTHVGRMTPGTQMSLASQLVSHIGIGILIEIFSNGNGVCWAAWKGSTGLFLLVQMKDSPSLKRTYGLNTIPCWTKRKRFGSNRLGPSGFV